MGAGRRDTSEAEGDGDRFLVRTDGSCYASWGTSAALVVLELNYLDRVRLSSGMGLIAKGRSRKHEQLKEKMHGNCNRL